MSGDSPIQWTDKSWNPVVGCERVSAGCDNCYAFALHDRRYASWKSGRWRSAPEQYHHPFSTAYKDPATGKPQGVQILRQRLNDPLKWRKPCWVFVNSMGDLFHEDVPFSFVDEVFEVMLRAERHTFQVLTKRPQRMRKYMLNAPWRRTAEWFDAAGWVPDNIWLGVSVENQEAANERIPLLLETPAAVRFLSCEPLIGEVGLGEYISPSAFRRCVLHHQRTDHPCGGRGDGADCEVCGTEWVDGEIGLHWVIVGGESGARARPMKLDWARTLIEQCRSAQGPLFVKQLGSVLAKGSRCRDGHGGDPEEWPEWLRVRQFPPAREQVKAS